MHQKLKWILSGMAAIAMLACAFFSGSYVGVREFMKYDILERAKIEAHDNLTLLNNLHENKSDSAIKFLEAKLDTAIVGFGVARQEGDSYLHLFPGFYGYVENKSSTNFLMERVSKYRKEHPSTIDDEMVQNLISSTLEEFD